MFTFIPEARPLSDQSPKAQGEGVGSRQNRPKNPKRRVPDWHMTLPLAQSCPRCGAQTRSGSSCRQAAMPNGRCRMHGGSSTGPTAAGIERIRQARTIHGGRSAEMIELRREMALLKRAARRTITAVW
jgi:ribosomal protein L32